MVYLIHLERSRTEVAHCIALLENDAAQTLNVYYIQPRSRLMAHLLALGLEWTLIRLWANGPWYQRWLAVGRKQRSTCPVCGVNC